MLGTSREYLNAILAKKVAMPCARKKLFFSTLVTKKIVQCARLSLSMPKSHCCCFETNLIVNCNAHKFNGE